MIRPPPSKFNATKSFPPSYQTRHQPRRPPPWPEKRLVTSYEQKMEKEACHCSGKREREVSIVISETENGFQGKKRQIDEERKKRSFDPGIQFNFDN